MSLYIVLAAVLVMAVFAIVVSYREDHPKKKKLSWSALTQGDEKGRTMTLAKQSEKKYTYADYLTWPKEGRWELIDGAPYNMTPAPSTRHQNVVVLFSRVLGNKLSGGPCRLFIAPTDVVLSELDVVQPDVFVVCDKKKITEANVQGAPNLILEVLSPATTLKDRREKKALYEKHGVLEYLIIDPMGKTVERHILKNERYNAPEIFGMQDALPLHSLDGIEIHLSAVFESE
jgi:Uma2 family endonuclease